MSVLTGTVKDVFKSNKTTGVIKVRPVAYPIITDDFMVWPEDKEIDLADEGGTGDFSFTLSAGIYELVYGKAITRVNIPDDDLTYTIQQVKIGELSPPLISPSLRQFDSVAQMVAVLNPSTIKGVVLVKGYYTPGDGGGGLFYWSSGGVNDGGIVITATNGGFWNRVLTSNYYNVLWWGAKGDGATDDTAAFTSAVAACVTGTGLMIPGDGTYILDNLQINKNISLIGEDRPTLKHKSGAAGIMITYTVAQSGVIRNIIFDGNKAANEAANRFSMIQMFSSNATFDHCEFRGYVVNGVIDQQCTSLLTFRDCLFLDGAEHGGAAGQATIALNVTINALNNVRAHLTLDNVRFIQSAAPSTSGKAPGGVHLKGSQANNAWVSLHAKNCRFEKIGQNFTDNRITCFEVYEFCDDVRIEDCVADGCYLAFCDIQASKKVIIRGNTIRNLSEANGAIQGGIKYDPGSGHVASDAEICLIEDNIIDGIPVGMNRPAIWVFSGSTVAESVKIRGNEIRNCPWGINIDGVGAVGTFIISENDISVAQDNAFSNGFALQFEDFAGEAIISNNRFIAGNKCNGISALVGMDNGTLLLDANYIVAETAAGFRCITIAGVKTVFGVSGIYAHTGAGTTIRIQKEGANLVQNLYWSNANYSVTGTENITTADIVNWLGHEPKFAAIRIAPEAPSLQIKKQDGTVLATYDNATGHFNLGPNAVSGTWKAGARNDVAAGAGVNFRIANEGAGGAGQLGVISDDNQGYVMAWSSTWVKAGEAYKADFFGLEAESSTAGIILNASFAGQVIQGYAGSTTQKTFEFDGSAVAGNTRFLVWDVDSAQLQRVKVGAAGTGPGGVGRALYLA